MELITIIISSMIINNIVLIQFLGLCSFFGVSTKMESVFGMSLAVIVVIVLSAIITYPLNTYVLEPMGISYIQTIAFILVIASLVQLVELVIKKASKSLYKSLGVYLPLIASNCAVLGVALTNVSSPKSYAEAIAFSFGSALGYALVIIAFTAIRLRLNTYAVPKALKGLPIALVTSGLMAIAFLGLVGLI
jgi:electron transport complex protein RnfA